MVLNDIPSCAWKRDRRVPGAQGWGLETTSVTWLRDDGGLAWEG